MITLWTDEEDKGNAMYDSIRGKRKNNTSGKNNSNKNQGVATKTTRVVTASAIQTTPSRLYSALRRTTPKRPLVASKIFSKRSVCAIWMAITPPISATNSSEHSRIFSSHSPPHDKKGKKKVDEGNDDFQEPDKTVIVLFGILSTKRSQKLTLRDVLRIEPVVPTPLRGRRYPSPSPAQINGQVSPSQDVFHWLLVNDFRQPRTLVMLWFELCFGTNPPLGILMR
jgi:hypothetical protein